VQLHLSQAEKQALKDLTETNQAPSRQSRLSPLIALVASAVLLLVPIGYCVKEFHNIEAIISSVGIYLLALVLCGIGFAFYYLHLVKQYTRQKRDFTLASAISKILQANQISL